MGTWGSSSTRASAPAGWSRRTSSVPAGSRTLAALTGARVRQVAGIQRGRQRLHLDALLDQQAAQGGGARSGWRGSGGKIQACTGPLRPASTMALRAAIWSASTSSAWARRVSRLAMDEVSWCSTAWPKVRRVPPCLRTRMPLVRDIS